MPLAIRPRRAFLLLLLAAITLSGLIVGPSAMASTGGAAELTSPVSASPATSAFAHLPTAVAVDGTGSGAVVTKDSGGWNWLPVDRWIGATSQFHSREAQGINPLNSMQGLERDIFAKVFMFLGNLLWSLISGLTSMAINLDLFDSVGWSIDNVAGQIGNSLFAGGGMVIAAILGVTLIWSLWTARKQGGVAAARIVGSKLGVIALMAVMVTGANSSTENELGGLSPGWILSTTNDVISTVASAPAAAIQMPFTDPREVNSSGTDEIEPYSCDVYTQRLRERYVTVNQSGGVLSNPAAVTPLVMSGMWEKTGLEIWKRAQFGDNRYGDRVYCRLLEWNSGVSPIRHADHTRAAVNSVRGTEPSESNIYVLAKTAAFNPLDDLDRDMSLAAWASCNGEVRYPDAIPNPDQAKDDDNADCAEWLTQGSDKLPDLKAADATTTNPVIDRFSTNHAMFDWENNPSKVRSHLTDNEEGREFILTMHGVTTGASGIGALAYFLSAVCIAVVFGGISIGIILAKLALLMMILGSFFILLMSMLPTANTKDRLTKLTKQALGYMVLAAGGVLIFSTIAVATNAIASAGNSVFGDGEVMGVVWTGASPLIAALGLNMLFKKVLKMPSPLSPKAALAYGAAAGGIGGAVGAAGSNFLSRRARAVGHQYEHRAIGAVSGAVRDRMPGTGRKGAMDIGGGRSSITKSVRQQVTGRPGVGGGGSTGAAASGVATGLFDGKAGQPSTDRQSAAGAIGVKPGQDPSRYAGGRGTQLPPASGKFDPEGASFDDVASSSRRPRPEDDELANSQSSQAQDEQLPEPAPTVAPGGMPPATAARQRADQSRASLENFKSGISKIKNAAGVTVADPHRATEGIVDRRKQLRAQANEARAMVDGTYQNYLHQAKTEAQDRAVQKGGAIGAEASFIRPRAKAIGNRAKDLGLAGLATATSAAGRGARYAAQHPFKTIGKTAKVGGKVLGYTALGAVGGLPAVAAVAVAKNRHAIASVTRKAAGAVTGSSDRAATDDLAARREVERAPIMEATEDPAEGHGDSPGGSFDDGHPGAGDGVPGDSGSGDHPGAGYGVPGSMGPDESVPERSESFETAPPSPAGGNPTQQPPFTARKPASGRTASSRMQGRSATHESAAGRTAPQTAPRASAGESPVRDASSASRSAAAEAPPATLAPAPAADDLPPAR